MNVRAPFWRRRILVPGTARILKIEEAGQASLPLFDRFGEVDGPGITLEHFDHRCRHLRNLQGRRFLELETAWEFSITKRPKLSH